MYPISLLAICSFRAIFWCSTDQTHFHPMLAKLFSRASLIKTKMIGQKSISSFFQPLGEKRVNEENKEANSPDAKKLKIESTPPRSLTSYSPDRENIPEDQKFKPLTPEQKRTIDENKLSAKIKLVTSSTNGLATNVGPTWFKALEGEFAKPYFLQLGKFVDEERKKSTVYPPAHQVFSFTQHSNIRDVSVVILGQDPYHGPSQAHGLCFSVQKGVPPPPSLVNMYKELGTDIEKFKHPGHGNLSGWARQGVLLLNAVLTVKAHNANSHKDKGWEKFTDAVVTWLNKNLNGVVFILWGAYAQKKGASIDKKRHHILKGVHPSPLSAHRGFFGCEHFSKCNQLLREQGKRPIDWNDLPPC